MLWTQPLACFFHSPLCVAPTRGTSHPIELSGSGFAGAGVPRPELPPAELPALLMKALELNDFPEVDAGLRSMWAFSGDSTRFIFKNNRSEFVESARETAALYPTSFYGMAMSGQGWELEGELNLVGGGDLSTVWIATQLMKTLSSDGRMRWVASPLRASHTTCARWRRRDGALVQQPQRAMRSLSRGSRARPD